MSETSFLIEQAVFSVNRARRLSDGRNEAALVDASEGASRDDLNAALDWATRVETLDAGYDPLNLFFLPTPSGALAIGRLTPTEKAEKDAFYFQMFFVEEDAFFQCGANPVALLHLALNTAGFALYRPGATLKAFRLDKRAPWIDQEDLRRTTERLGIRALTTLIQTILDSKRTAFVADYNAFQVVAALFELTPIHWRPSLTFAVGVRFGGDSLLRLIGSTAKRGDDRWSVEGGATFCDLRDVVERDDAYPIENAWAALVELALKSNRVDYLYERMAEEFFLFQQRRDAGDERGTSSDEVAEMGLSWRLDLEDAIRDKKDGTEDGDKTDDEAADDERSDEAEPFFDGEFEGGWRDSDGDERWRADEADAAEKKTADDRAAPEFVFIVDPTETARVETSNDREKGRENDAAQKKNDNNENKEKRDGEKERRAQPASLDDIFSGESFEDEWAATEGRRDESENKARIPLDGEKKRTEKKKDECKQDKTKATLEALRRVLFVKNGAVGTGGRGRWVIVGGLDEIGELVKKDRAFDEPLGLDGLANLNALLDESGAEALERLRRAFGDDENRDDDRRASERNARRLRLAPFAALSAEFPGWNEELRRFDALFDDACSGNAAALDDLRDFWRRWRRELDDKTVDRIRAAYEERLRGRLASEDGAVARMERLLTALEIYTALFFEI